MKGRGSRGTTVSQRVGERSNDHAYLKSSKEREKSSEDAEAAVSGV